MDKLQLLAQYIGDGYYQVFIKNISYPCDFIEIVQGRPIKQGKKNVLYITDWNIYSPFKPGEKIFIDEINPATARVKCQYIIDTKLRKPTRLMESFEAISPASSKLPKSIGSEYQFEIRARQQPGTVRQYVDENRINVKDRYQLLRKTYLDIIAAITPQENSGASWKEAPAVKGLLDELLLLHSFEKPYNEGVMPKQFKESINATYYEWFIKDWDLTEPNGEPPAEAIDIERSIRIND